MDPDRKWHDVGTIWRGLTMLAAATPPVLASGAAWASASPEGAEFVMADWMLLSFLSFAGAALLVFLIAVRRGMFAGMEDAKYHLLSVKEPDYYTPDWAKEDADAP
ncbi:MAG TPA: hypothetical protein ENH55_10785 [Aurantimonas coralicida]|uniref:Uncharacterized protein n=2 Tax=root TaxID=1 RepID=A0A9C9NCS5_9HYPH|nr:hypothetical protein [Aurantimonas coralicida]HET99452.1 hypothetical protein [Aurantimonas coralicida]